MSVSSASRRGAVQAGAAGLAGQIRDRVGQGGEVGGLDAGAVEPGQRLSQHLLDARGVETHGAALDLGRQLLDRRDQRRAVDAAERRPLHPLDRAAHDLLEPAGVELLGLPLDGFAHLFEPRGQRVDGLAVDLDLGRAAEGFLQPRVHRRQRRVDAVGVDHRRGAVELGRHGVERRFQPRDLRRNRLRLLQARAHAFDAPGQILDRLGIERDGRRPADGLVELGAELAQGRVQLRTRRRLVEPGADVAERGFQAGGVRGEAALGHALDGLDAPRQLFERATGRTRPPDG